MVTSTAPNGSFTDGLFGLIGKVVDTAGQALAPKTAAPTKPAPTDAPKIPQPAPGLPPAPAAEHTGMLFGLPPLAVAGLGAAAVVGVVLLIRVLK